MASFAITALLAACSKDPSKLVVADFVGKDSTAAYEAIHTSSPAQEKLLREALLRLAKHDSLGVANTWTIAEVEKNQAAWVSYLKPRAELYNKAVAAVKARLKVPDSAKIPLYEGFNSDSASVIYKSKDSAIVSGTYKSQNMFGVYLNGSFEAKFIEKNGNWQWEWGHDGPTDFLDFRLN